MMPISIDFCIFKRLDDFNNLILVVTDMLFSSKSNQLFGWFKSLLSNTLKVKLCGKFLVGRDINC